MFQQSDVTSSRADSLASHFPLPGSSEARKMTATSGRQCSTLSRSVGPLGCLVKMLLASSTWNSTIAALIWKTSVTKSNRLLFQLVPLGHCSIESGFGFAPTPNSRDFRDVSKTTAHLAARNRHTPSLATECLNRGMNWKVIAEAYSKVMGYPVRWCEMKSNVTATPSSRKLRLKSSKE